MKGSKYPAMDRYELLYSKQFTHDEPDYTAAAAIISEAGYTPPGKDYIQRILDSVSLRPLEKRERRRVNFILASAMLSELYELDIEIKENCCCVSTVLSFEHTDFMYFLKPLISMADDLGFRAKGGKVVMTLDFYTHAVYRGDKLILPHNMRTYSG